jgi:multidrug efflux pump subunit AcrB
VLLVGVFPRSGDLSFARRLAEREIKTRLQQVSGVASVGVVGGARDEVKVLVDQEKAAARGVTLADIAEALAGSNVDSPAGSITEGSTELLVKTEGPAKDVPALGEFSVAGNGGTRFEVREVARIARGTRERVSLFMVDGREGVGLQVYRRPRASPVALSRGVRAELGRLSRAYGRDLELVVARDSSLFISRSLSDLVLSAAAGAAIAFLVVLLFVRDIATSLMLVCSVPISIVVSLLFLRVAGRSLNVMSIGGLSMGIGMMMDNSVVILENLQRRLLLGGGDEGGGRGGGRSGAISPEAVVSATDEMSGSNVGSTVTSIVVFLPVIFLPGVIGAVFADLALSVIFSQVTSLAVSVTLIPVLFRLSEGARERMRVGRERRRTARERRRGTPSAGTPSVGMARIERLFRRILRAFFRKPLILAAILAATTAAGIACFRLLPFEFLPSIDTGEIDLTIALPGGSTIEHASRVGAELSERLLAFEGVRMVHAKAGGEQEDLWYLADPLEAAEILHMTAALSTGRRRTASAVAEEMRRAIAAGDESVSVELPGNIVAPLLGLSSGRSELVVNGKDQQEAVARARELADAIRALGGGETVALSPSGEKPELRITPDREAVARSGTDIAALALAARAALDGVVPTSLLVDGRDEDVRVMLRPEEAVGVAGVESLRIRGPGGGFMRLSDLARVAEAGSPAALARVDRGDVAFVRFAAAGPGRREDAGAIEDILRTRPYARSLETSALQESMSPLLLTFALVILLLYLALGAQFESFVLPLFLLACLPLSFFGIVAALALAGKSLNVDSILGVIVLFGIAVNNTIVLYETYAHRMGRAHGGGALVAIYRGTSERLRPILITMLTTVTALVPIALDASGTSTQASMAVAIIGGLFVSTTLTLFAAPMMFYRFLGRRGRAV